MAAVLEHVHAFIASQEDPRELVTLEEMLRLGRADCLYAGDDGVLARVRRSGMVFIAGRDVEAACSIARLPLLPGGATLAEAARLPDGERPITMSHDARQPEAIGFPVTPETCYNICIYEGERTVELSGGLSIRQLGPDDLDAVVAHYDMISPADVVRHLEDGWVWGGFDAAGDLVGFIGEHDEGSMGMLEVFPEHRRRGYARELEGYAVNRMLGAGRVPFGQVVIGNEASFALQASIGMTRLSGVQCWTE